MTAPAGRDLLRRIRIAAMPWTVRPEAILRAYRGSGPRISPSSPSGG